MARVVDNFDLDNFHNFDWLTMIERGAIMLRLKVCLVVVVDLVDLVDLVASYQTSSLIQLVLRIGDPILVTGAVSSCWPANGTIAIDSVVINSANVVTKVM